MPGPIKSKFSNNRYEPFFTEFDALMEFLAEKTENVEKPLTLIHLFSEYRVLRRLPSTPKTIKFRFRQQLVPIIPRFEKYNDETKVKIMFGTSSEVPDDFLEKLKKSAKVEVDDQNRITKYHSITLKLEGKHINFGANVKTEPLEQPFDFHRVIKEEPSDVVALEPPVLMPFDVTPAFGDFPSSDSPSLPSVGSEQLEQASGNFLNNLGVFMNSISNMMETRMARMQTQIGAPPTPAIQESSNSSSITTRITLKQFLTFLKMCIVNLDSPHLTEIHSIVSTKLGDPESDRDLPIGMARLALFSLLSEAMSNGNANKMVDETRNARKFMNLIDVFIVAYQNPLFSFIEEEIQKRRESIDEHKQINVGTIRAAFESALITLGIKN